MGFSSRRENPCTSKSARSISPASRSNTTHSVICITHSNRTDQSHSFNEKKRATCWLFFVAPLKNCSGGLKTSLRIALVAGLYCSIYEGSCECVFAQGNFHQSLPLRLPANLKTFRFAHVAFVAVPIADRGAD